MKITFKNSILPVILLIIYSCGNDTNNKAKITTVQEQDQSQQQIKADANDAKITTVHVQDRNEQRIKVNKLDENQKRLKKSPKEKWNNIILPKPDEVEVEDQFEGYVEVVDPKDAEYYKAYNKVLPFFGTAYTEANLVTSKGIAHLIVSGPKNGNPVVLLHGMNASSTSWYPNIKALSQNNRVYAIDNIMEPGKSRLNGEMKDMNEVVKWYIEVFDILKLKSFDLIGASKGGWLSVNIAIQSKERIRHLILLSPAQTFIWITPGSKLLSNITYKMDPKKDRLPKVLSTVSYNVDNINDAFIDQYYISTVSKPKNKFIIEMRPYSDNELKTLTMPVLVLIGDHDIINNEKSIKKANKLLPHCQAYIIKNAGHFLSIDQSEIVNEKMLYFLKK